MYVQQWDIGTALNTGWERFKTHAAGVLVAMIVTGVILFVLSLVGNIAQQIPTLLTEAGVDEVIVLVLIILVQTFFGIINLLVQTWFGLGMIKVYLKAARDEEPGLGDLFSVGNVYLTGLLAALLLAVAYLGGALFTWFLLFIPLIIMSLGLWMHKFLIIDQELGPIECLKESWRITSGEKGDLFLWAIVTFFINLAGALCCLVGLLITVPVTSIATAYIFDNMVQRKGRADGSEYSGADGSEGSDSFGDASFDKPAPSSRSTTDGNAPLMGKD